MAGASGRHHRTACAFLLVAVLAGLLSGAFSLLARVPPGRIAIPPDAVRLLAAGHAPLMLLGCALPALLGGMGLLLVPDAIGARDTAFPRLSAAAAVLVAAGTVLFASGLLSARPVLLWPAFACWTAGLVSCASDLLTTLLDHRSTQAPALPPFASAVATACPLAVASLPVLLGCALRLSSDADLLGFLSGILVWPPLLLLVILALGLVGEVLVGDGARRSTAAAPCGWILAGTAATAFLFWCGPILGHGALHPALLRTVLLTPGVLVLLLSATAAVRSRFLFRLSGASELAVAAFLSVTAVATIWTLASGLHLPAHYVLSAGSAFALLAGLYRWLDRVAPRTVSPLAGRCQLVLLFSGIHLMLLPRPILAALGAACCAASLVLVAAILLSCLWRPVLRRTVATGASPR